MTQFKFRLATLLRLREATRDERRSELAEAYRADQVLQDQRNQVDAELAELRKQYKAAAGPGSLDPDWLLEMQRYELVMKGRQQVLAEQQKRLTAEIERRREVLVAADREVRVLEKLRQTQQDQHAYEENRQEIKQWDEFAGQRHARREPVT